MKTKVRIDANIVGTEKEINHILTLFAFFSEHEEITSVRIRHRKVEE